MKDIATVIRSAMLDWNHPREPENMLSTPMAAMNSPIIFVTIPNACSPTYFMMMGEHLRMTHVSNRAIVPAIMTVSIHC